MSSTAVPYNAPEILAQYYWRTFKKPLRTWNPRILAAYVRIEKACKLRYAVIAAERRARFLAGE